MEILKGKFPKHCEHSWVLGIIRQGIEVIQISVWCEKCGEKLKYTPVDLIYEIQQDGTVEMRFVKRS
jgi:hypothetical protein